MYITILIYSNSYGSRTVYYNYDILFHFLLYILYITILIPLFISQPKLYITTLISDFLPLSLLFLKISAVPLVRRFFFTLFCCETALLLGFGCETTPFLRFRSPFHYTWHFRLWCGFTTPSSGWEYPFYSPFAPLSYPLQYWYLSLTNAFIVGLLY